MAQALAIFILMTWGASAVYLYKVDPFDDRYKESSNVMFALDVLLRSIIATVTIVGLTLLVVGLVCIAFGLVN